jgi:hypothetical protein
METFLDLTGWWCSDALRICTRVVEGGIVGCLSRVRSSWGKVSAEELPLEGGHGLFLGALQAFLAEEQRACGQPELGPGTSAGSLMEGRGVIVEGEEGEELTGETVGQAEEGEMGLDSLFWEGGCEVVGEVVGQEMEEGWQLDVQGGDVVDGAERTRDMEGEEEMVSNGEVAIELVSGHNFRNEVLGCTGFCFCSVWRRHI